METPLSVTIWTAALMAEAGPKEAESVSYCQRLERFEIKAFSGMK